MRETVQRFVGFVLPTLLNAGLALWIVWHVGGIPRQGMRVTFGSFVLLYAVGGLAIVLSCASAFLMLAVDGVTEAPQRRRWLMLALVNIIIPSVLLVLLLSLR